jgi:hypothetical protein
MADLIICEAADAFLEGLYATDEESAATLDIIFQELFDDQECLSTLHHYTPKWIYHLSRTFEFKRFEEAWKIGRRIYILKARDEDGYRLDYRALVAHDIRDDSFYVLSVAHRGTAYDAASKEFAELVNSYDERGIPVFSPRGAVGVHR